MTKELCCVQYKVMVTAGANQALVSLMLTLLDPSDRAVLFRPYYFNTLMAIQVGLHVRLPPGTRVCAFSNSQSSLSWRLCTIRQMETVHSVYHHAAVSVMRQFQ